MLLNIPTESLAIRAVIGSVVALLVARMLLAAGLRLPRVRTVAVLVPTVALVVIAAVSWRDAGLPTVMIPVEAINALPIPVGDGYLRFAPAAWPMLLGAWAALAALRVAWRTGRVLRTRRAARRAFDLATTADVRVRGTVARVAHSLRVVAPPVAVVDQCDGGAIVVGMRRPVLVLDRTLVSSLDDEEMEGLIAHELAHVRRRDNSVAFGVGIARDLAFFVPGGRWVLRRLNAERELAADQLAVETTGRPGALASGLLKVIDAQVPTPACAAFAPRGSLETRVRRLVEVEAPVTRLRRALEVGAVAGALALAVLAAIGVPALVVSSAPEGRDALAVVYTQPRGEGPATPAGEATVFEVYRANGFATTDAPIRRPEAPDDGRDLNPAVLRADAGDRVGYSPFRDRGLGIVPRARVSIAADLEGRWRATPVVPVEQGGFGLLWLHEVNEAR